MVCCDACRLCKIDEEGFVFSRRKVKLGSLTELAEKARKAIVVRQKKEEKV